MDINIALANFEIAYRELIGAIEGQKESEPGVVLHHCEVVSDIGTFRYLAENITHAKNQFRAAHGFNHIKIINVRKLQTNVDNGKQL